MKIILSWRRHHYVARVSIFLLAVALIAGIGGCALAQFNLTISSTEGGEVTSPSEGTHSYVAGTVVNLVATSDAGYHFVKWTGDVGTIDDVNNATTTIIMMGNYAITANFQAEQVVYDFVSEASDSYTQWMSGAGELTFPGATDDNKGFACYRTNIILEDGLTYDKVLETHPNWVDNGSISGTYTGVYWMGYKVEAGDHFYAKVGFLKDATAGNVKYRVMARLEIGNIWIAEITDNYDGTLKTIDVDLSPYANQKADFILEVDANGPATQDWATWVEAKIIR